MPKSPGFSEIRKQTTAQAVTEVLQAYIIDNKLKPGDILPSEHELSSQLKVSRNCLREALQNFKAVGIIESKPKVGAILKQLIPKNPFAGYLPFIKSNQKRKKELMQIRLILDLGIIPLLMEKFSEKDRKYLMSIANKFKKSTLAERLDMEKEFHSYLLKIPQNEILYHFQHVIYEFFDYSVNTSSGKKGKSVPEIAKEHVDIVNALAKKDEEKLRKLILDIYEASIDK